MWGLFSKLTPFLLAATTSIGPQTPTDLAANFRQLYVDLETPGKVSRDVTPTLRFSYVPPPIIATSTNSESSTEAATPTTTTSLWSPGTEDNNVLPEDGESKPVAIYLPGLDGYGISAARYQFNDLASTFEFWRLVVLPEDRSTFWQLVEAITDFVEQLVTTRGDDYGDRQVVLVGESCGGLLASAVALQLKQSEILKGLVLVNPATSFEQTPWDTLVPVITSLQYLDPRDETQRQNGQGPLSPYAVLGSLMLSALIPDLDQTRRIVDTIRGLPALANPSPETFRNLLDGMTDAFRGTEERLPPAVLEHRVIKWLLAGTSTVNSRLSQIQVPTLVVAGREDRLMPSAQEADRLVDLLPQAEKLVVPNRGHFVLDDTVNLTEAILYSQIDPLDWKNTKTKYDPIHNWQLPPPHEFTSVVERTVQPLRTAHSPIYISTDHRGKRWFGLSKIPRPEGPLLFVGNHQFVGLDLRLVLSQLFEERGMFPRGLAHPVTFLGEQKGELGGRRPGLPNGSGTNPLNGDFARFGAVTVTPRNYYRLLQTGQDALLFPGGAKEALTGRKDYPLFWPEKVDFVRTAARFNATIVPLSAVGMVDSVNVLAEVEDVLKLPFIGERARAASVNVSSARFDQPDEDEVIGFPLVAPSLPDRNYFLFGQPISTKDLDPSDKVACARLYDQAQSAVRRGLDDILQARKQDPFRNTPRRLAYERVFGKTAPTFSIDRLNRN